MRSAHASAPRPALARALVLAATISCTGLTAAGAGVRESDGRGIESCQYLGEFVGRAGDPHDARVDALNAAGARGADFIVWTDDDGRPWPTRSTFVYGKGYRCP
jgi:hypothetical protein